MCYITFAKRNKDEARRREVVDRILSRYWEPMYYYLRRKGYKDAEKLVQEFCMKKVWERSLIQRARKAKGRFRTFLLTALRRYANDVDDYENAKKRKPEKPLVPLEKLGLGNLPEPPGGLTPERAFTYKEVSKLLDQVRGEVKEHYCRRGKATHWEVFREAVWAPIQTDEPAPSLAELCKKHGISDEAKASSMITTVRRRCAAVLWQIVRPTVSCDEEVDEEIRDLMRILSESGAG
jgi:RNA polymerase sigma-70 factor (ECF subfamily)